MENLSCLKCRKSLNISFLKSLQSKHVFMILGNLEEKTNTHSAASRHYTLKILERMDPQFRVLSRLCLKCTFVMRSPWVAGASKLTLGKENNDVWHLQTQRQLLLEIHADQGPSEPCWLVEYSQESSEIWESPFLTHYTSVCAPYLIPSQLW